MGFQIGPNKKWPKHTGVTGVITILKEVTTLLITGRGLVTDTRFKWPPYQDFELPEFSTPWNLQDEYSHFQVFLAVNFFRNCRGVI